VNQSIEYPRFRWLVLAAVVVAFTGCQVTGLSVAPVLSLIAGSLHINLGTASNVVLTSSVFSGSLMMVFMGGAVCDRYGVLVAVMLGALCSALQATLMPWLGLSTAGVFWARIVQGCAAGFLFTAIGAVVGVWFPTHEKGLAGGLMSAAIAAGSALGMVAGPTVLQYVGDWRTMCVWMSPLSWAAVIFTAILASVSNQKPPLQPAKKEISSRNAIYKDALISPLTVIGVGITFMAMWGTQCLYALTAPYLAAAQPVGAGYGPLAAGQLMLGVTLFGGVAGPIFCGFLLDKAFRGNSKAVFLIGFGLLCVFSYALTLPWVVSKVGPLEVSLIFAGFGIQFISTTIYYFVARAYAPQVVGKMSGTWMGMGTFGGVLGLYVGGLTVKSQGNYHSTLLLQSLSGLIGFLLVFWLGAAQKRAKRSSEAGQISEVSM
jgi:MFS family permease